MPLDDDDDDDDDGGGDDDDDGDGDEDGDDDDDDGGDDDDDDGGDEDGDDDDDEEEAWCLMPDGLDVADDDAWWCLPFMGTMSPRAAICASDTAEQWYPWPSSSSINECSAGWDQCWQILSTSVGNSFFLLLWNEKMWWRCDEDQDGYVVCNWLLIFFNWFLGLNNWLQRLFCN